MSLSFDSVESVFDFISSYYKPHLKPYFDHSYVEIFQKMMVHFNFYSSKNKIVFTPYVMLEPIITINEFIIISLPLLAEFVNMPLLKLEEKAQKLTYTSFKSLFSSMNELSKSSHNNNRLMTTNEKTKLLEPNKKMVVIILMRLYIILHHWNQHYKLDSCENLSHENFYPIEFAQRIKNE